jgi:hypothetical protein
MVARLQLASHRAHWIEVTRNKRADKADFHKYLSDPMTQSAKKTNSDAALCSLMVPDAEILDAGSFLSEVPQS